MLNFKVIKKKSLFYSDAKIHFKAVKNYVEYHIYDYMDYRIIELLAINGYGGFNEWVTKSFNLNETIDVTNSEEICNALPRP